MKIIILSFDTGDVHVFNFPKNIEDGIEFFDTKQAKKFKLSESNCQWMVVESLKLQIH